ncbi:unnamed protein product [Lathyrus oleraceus]
MARKVWVVQLLGRSPISNPSESGLHEQAKQFRHYTNSSLQNSSAGVADRMTWILQSLHGLLKAHSSKIMNRIAKSELNSRFTSSIPRFKREIRRRSDFSFRGSSKNQSQSEPPSSEAPEDERIMDEANQRLTKRIPHRDDRKLSVLFPSFEFVVFLRFFFPCSSESLLVYVIDVRLWNRS